MEPGCQADRGIAEWTTDITSITQEQYGYYPSSFPI